MKILETLFRVLILKTTLAAWGLVRKFPLVAACVAVFVVLLPSLARRYQFAGTIWGWYLLLRLWVNGGETRFQKVFRASLVFAVLFFVPGGFLLAALFRTSEWIEGARDDGDDTTIGPPLTAGELEDYNNVKWAGEE